MATTTRKRRSTDTRNDHPHADEEAISSKWLCGPTQTEQGRTHDTNKAHQPEPPPRTRQPPEPMHRYGINYLGTLLSSQRTDAHPPLTLAGSWPEARSQIYQSSWRAPPRFPSALLARTLSELSCCPAVPKKRPDVPRLYQRSWSAVTGFMHSGAAFPDSTVPFLPFAPVLIPAFATIRPGQHSPGDAERPRSVLGVVAPRDQPPSRARCPFLPAGQPRERYGSGLPASTPQVRPRPAVPTGTAGCG